MIERAASAGWWREQLARAWSKPELRWLAAIVVLATVLRIVWVVYASRQPQELHDPTFYLFYGAQIADGNGYRLLDGAPTAYYPIGYPAALGGVFALVKHTAIPDNLTLAAGFFQVALGVATVVLGYEVGRRLFGVTVGLLAALWLAVFPNLIYHTAAYLTETLFNFLVLAAILVLVSGDWRARRLGLGRLAFFGFLLALSALVRPISLLFLPLLIIVWLAFGFGWWRSVGYGAAIAVVAALAVLPWTVRNIIVMESPVIISTNLGDNLCMGHYAGAPGHFTLPEQCFSETEYAGIERPEFEIRRNDDNTRKAIEFALDHPVAELKLLSRKAYHTWEDDHDGLWAVESYGHDAFIDPTLRSALAKTADIFYFVTISLGGLGLLAFVLPPRDGRRVFFLLALLALAGAPLAFFGDARFHVPVLPLLSVAAAWTVVAGVRAAPRLVATPDTRSAVVERTEGERSVPEQDALQDP